jgi:hypothetical protein
MSRFEFTWYFGIGLGYRFVKGEHLSDDHILILPFVVLSW